MNRDRPGPPSPLLDLLPPPRLDAAWSSPPPPRPQWLRALGLFVLTFLTVTTISPVLLLLSRTDVQTDLYNLLLPRTVLGVWGNPELLGAGLAIAGTLLTILLAHEMGHYLVCRHYGISATVPYFLPLPFAFGTLGAFIRIREPIREKRKLFDVGVAGPLAGFVVLVPFLLYGVAHSRVGTFVELAEHDPSGKALFLPGRCLAIELVARSFYGRLLPGQTLDLHPIAFGAWFGLFATALNLLPLSQLDGGHLLYAVLGRRQERLARPLWLVLAAAGFLWPGWWVWCVLVLLLRLRHPPVEDEDAPLNPARRWIAVLALLLLVLCFIPVPLREIVVR